MPTLHISRIRLIAVKTFKILHKMSPVNLQDLLSYKNSIYSFRYDNLVDVPRVRTAKYGKSQGPSWPRILGRSDFSLQEN